MIRRANDDDIDPEWIILTGHGQADEVIEALNWVSLIGLIKKALKCLNYLKK
jgi:hypothetical protein